jgi:hypothetical protein
MFYWFFYCGNVVKMSFQLKCIAPTFVPVIQTEI